MYKKILLFTLIIGVVLFNSCQKNEKPQTEQDKTGRHEAVAVSRVSNTGFVLSTGVWIYTADGADDGTEATKVKGIKEMSLGESILVGDPRQLTWAGNGKLMDFIEIRRDNGEEGFALAYQINKGGRLAVVTDEKANLYKTSKVIDVTSTILSRKSVVVYLPETETAGFVEVRGWDIDRKQFVNPNFAGFVRSSTLSRKDPDIQSAILLITALSITDDKQKERRDTLLKSALEFYSDSIFYDEIFEIMYPNSTSGVISNTDDNW